MNNLLKYNLLFFALLFTTYLSANDGVFYASGNHLIPMDETDISVMKEVLTITRVEKDYLQVDVEYEFYNPKEAKRLLVGFEAPSPSGDVDGHPVDGRHPYMEDFSVLLNSKQLDYKTAMVTDDLYYKDGKILSKTESELIDEDFHSNDPDFYYVYHFDALFEKGKNKLSHRYKFLLSGSVAEEYYFDYILTAANRWANKQIDDFTLIIDMGEFQDFRIANTFFDSYRDWKGEGVIQAGKDLEYSDHEGGTTHFLMRQGPIHFHQLNFHPQGELSLIAPLQPELFGMEEFNHKEHQLSFSIRQSTYLTESADEISQKILRNLPYARRGYIFKTASIQTYYEDMPWYQADPNYKASLEDLTKEEQEWLREVRGQ